MTTRKWKYVIVFPNDPEYKGMDHYYKSGKLTCDLNDATEFQYFVEAKEHMEDAKRLYKLSGKGYLKPVIEKCHTKITIEKSIMGKLVKISKEKEDALYEEQDV
jgi:hypothetical protein